MNQYIPISELGWIDFSETDKQKVMKVIEMMQADGTVDELGVGVIRNALSDAMFPGVTTIMTRAKYFFIIPRIIQSYISHPAGKGTVREYLRQEENDIMHYLAKKYQYNEDERIIGVSVAKQNQYLSARQHKELVRKPSTIYWNGLRTFKLYGGELSLANFLNTLSKKSNADLAMVYHAEEGETPNDRDADTNENYIFSLPDFDKNWKEQLVIDLTPAEANFLKHKIIDLPGNVLYSEVLKQKLAIIDFLKADSFQDMCEMPFVKSLSPKNQTIISTAKDFWQIMYGAHIRYNMLLHSRHGSADYKKKCFEYWKSWISEMQTFKWLSFNRELMWEIVTKQSKVKSFTYRFVNNWMDLMQNKNYDTAGLDQLVEKQEGDNKGSLSKLKLQNDEKYDKWIGISNMDFRFGNTKTIIRDISTQL